MRSKPLKKTASKARKRNSLLVKESETDYVISTREFEIGISKLIQGDSLDVLRSLSSDSFVLAFTSPPYLNAINYEEHVEKIKGQRLKWERKDISYNEYKLFLVDRFSELFRVIQPGGYNVVNISPIAWNGVRVPLPFQFVTWMEEIGWKFKEDIIWEKPIARDKRSGVLMQHPYPGYYYPSLVAEYVFVFQKPSERKNTENIYWNRSQKEKTANKISLANYQGEMSKNVWKIRPLSPQENIHPCPFPLELAERVVQFYSYKGDNVIDIFTGSGQTNIAAERLGRRSIGIDIQETYIKYALERLQKIASQEKLFT